MRAAANAHNDAKGVPERAPHKDAPRVPQYAGSETLAQVYLG
jgi:hypothetical protein